MGYIYVLSDPRTDEVRYVGKTASHLRRRLSTHLAQARRRSNHREKWVASLLDSGLRPHIELIEAVPDGQADDAERYWIRMLRRLGCRLTNATDGGDGGRMEPDIERRRLANGEWYRKAQTVEAKTRRSAAARKRWAGMSEEERHRALAPALAATSARTTEQRRADIAHIPREVRAAHASSSVRAWWRSLDNEARVSYLERHRAATPRGSQHGGAKLDEQTVVALRQRHAQGDLTYKETAALFGVCERTAWLVANRKTWVHVP